MLLTLQHSFKILKSLTSTLTQLSMLFDQQILDVKWAYMDDFPNSDGFYNDIP